MTDYSDPRKYRVLDGGAIYDKEEGRIVAHLPGKQKYSIDKARSVDFAARKKQIGTIAQMRGLARAEGIELPEDAQLEELVEAAGDAVESLFHHMAKTFKQSKNLRGMGESIGRLTAGFVDADKVHVVEVPPAEQPTILVQIAQYISLMKEEENNVVDGEVTDT